MKYHIIPKENVVIVAEGADPEDAMARFAATMDSDMNTYFRALTEEEYEEYVEEHSDSAAHRRHVTAFMKNELMNEFDVEDEAVAQELAEYAYERYEDGDGLTEYECIEKAYDEHAADYDIDEERNGRA